MSKAKAQFFAGVRSEIPIVVGVVPFGLIFGVVASEAHIPAWIAWSTSWLVFGGSAQFLAVPLIKAGAPAATLIFTTFVINLRHALYSASLAPHAKHLSKRWKLILSYLLTDEAYAPTVLHYHRTDDLEHAHWFWLGAGTMLWLNWQLSTAAGIYVGTMLPDGLGLEFTLALTFIGIVVPTLHDWPHIGTALASGVTAVLAYPLPYKLNLMVAAAVGISMGLGLERRKKVIS